MICVLSLQPVAERGGSDQGLLRLVRSLPREDFDCHIVVPTDPPLRSAFEAAGATVHILPMRRITTRGGFWHWPLYALAWPVTVLRLVWLARRVRPDVWHTNSLHSWYGWAAAFLTRLPHVWSAREIVVQSRLAALFERFLTRHFADMVVSVSEAVAAELHPKNGRVLIEDVDSREFCPEEAGNFRASCGIPDDVFLVGAAGRVDTWKGFDLLLLAHELVTRDLPRGFPAVHLVICGMPVFGKEEYEAGLRAKAAVLPRVHWFGPCEDMPTFYADLDLFLLCSTAPEPFGLVLIEALASGVPVVASDQGGPPEILREFPERGRLVLPGDAEALAVTVLDMVRDIVCEPGRSHDHDLSAVQGDAFSAAPASSLAQACLSLSTEQRRRRKRLWFPSIPPYAELFSEVVAESE